MIDIKVFKKIPKGSAPPLLGAPIISDLFIQKGATNKNKRLFQLYNDKLYYYDEKDNQNPLGVADIDFDLQFQIIRDKSEKIQGTQKIKLGKSRGIRFERGGNIKELFSTDEGIINKWRDVLRNQINQKGFHELFRAHQQIGKGNFASVYLAERLEDEKQFAVKAFSKQSAYGQENGKEAIVNQVYLMRQINHPNIIRLHQVFQTDNSLYLIIDLLEGGQLYDKIKAKYQFSMTDTQKVMGGLVAGLQCMHERRIMHRDLKPENIIFRNQNDFEVVIVDLGLATNADLKEYMFVRCGTPGYVAPEVVNIRDLHTTYDPICDMYSIGLIFYVLLVGKPAFNGKTYADILTMNRQAAVKYDDADFKRIPHQAVDLLKQMLDPDPQTRIKAKDALEHQFFLGDIKTPQVTSRFANKEEQKDKMYDEDDENDDVEDENTDIKLNDENLFDMTQLNAHMNSPALYAQDKMRKQSIMKDSCLDFQMSKTPVITGRTDAVNDLGHNSPNLQLSEEPARGIKQMPSRFSGKSGEGEPVPMQSPFMSTPKPENTLKQVHLTNLYQQATQQQGQKQEGTKDVKETQVATSNIRKGLSQNI